jgi:hypothetical protein
MHFLGKKMTGTITAAARTNMDQLLLLQALQVWTGILQEHRKGWQHKLQELCSSEAVGYSGESMALEP